MGLFGSLATALGLKKRPLHIVVVGLDNSGKTTLINQLKPEPHRTTTDIVPTIGFNTESFKVRNVTFTAVDVSGQSRYRGLWEHHFDTCDALVFVVDSSDRLRIVVARDELDTILQHRLIRDQTRLPLLFFANKMDVPDAMTSVKVALALGLERLGDKPFHICSSNALTGQGLEEGLDWLIQQLQSRSQR